MSEAPLPVEAGTSLQEGESPAEHKNSTEPKTPAKSGKGTKRKCPSPVTPANRHSSVDAELTSSVKRRRKSASGNRVGSPLLKPALTERQQMALIMQMTDPQKQGGAGSGGEESLSTTPRSDPSWTPRSKVLRKNERGETLLHTAAIKGDIKSATSLIEQGAEVNITDNAGWTPLHEACNYGHPKVVALLLKHQANVNVHGMDGDTPLHDAAMNGHLETVKLLLDYRGNPYLENDQGLTPIDVCKNQDILSLLHQGGGAHGGVREDSEEEEEDVFVARDKTVRIRDSHLKTGSKGSSHSSADSIYEEELAKDGGERGCGLYHDVGDVGNTPDVLPINQPSHTPKSRPRNAIYSDLSSSESDSDVLDPPGKLGGRKVRYHLAKMGEAKQKLLGKLEESGELESRHVQVTENGGRGREYDNEAVENNHEASEQQAEPLTQEEKEEGGKEMGETYWSERVSPSAPHSPAPYTAPGDTPPKESASTNQSPVSPPHSSSPQATSWPATGYADSAQPQVVDKSCPDIAALALSPKPHPQPSAKLDVTSSSPKPVPDINTPAETPPTSPPGDVDADKDPEVATPPMEASSMQEALSHQGASHDQDTPMEDEEAAPTRLLRSAVRRVRHSVSEEAEEREGLVVSLSLKLVKSRHSSFEGEANDESRRRSDGGDHASSHSKSDLDPHKLARRLGPMRSDSTSSVESRSSLSGREGVAPGERVHSKHSRKPQQVFSSKRLLVEEEGGREGRKRSDSLSVSVDWGALPSNMSLNNSSFSATPTIMSSSSHSGPTSEPMDTFAVGGVQSEETTPSTIVSLPLLYSAAHTESLESAESASSNSAPHPLAEDNSERVGTVSKDSSTKVKLLPPEVVKPVADANGENTPLKRDRGGASGSVQGPFSCGPRVSHESMDISCLPPKKRYRPVMRSQVVQQRQLNPSPTVPTPAHMASFVMFTGDYRSRKSIQPFSPKLVYPPMIPAMYKMFSDHESERVKLVTAHLTEQDRMVITMEQEVLRAHQRATNKYPPLSVCLVLMENLLLGRAVERGGAGGVANGYGASGSRQNSSDVANSEEQVDCKLLSGLMQDVWDRFQDCRHTHSTRQRHEAETMWLMQRLQWKERLLELGMISSVSADHEVPKTHTPLPIPALYSTH